MAAQQQQRRYIQETSAFEKHAQTVIAAVALGLLLFTGNTMLDIRTQSARMDTQLTTFQQNFAERLTDMSQQISNLKADVNKASEDKFRGADATAAFARRDIALDDHEKRIRELERTLLKK